MKNVQEGKPVTSLVHHCGHPDPGVAEHSWCGGSDKWVGAAVVVCLMW